MPLDQSVAYYWTSLGLSAAAVFLFLWLVREQKPDRGDPIAGRRETRGGQPAAPSDSQATEASGPARRPER